MNTNKLIKYLPAVATTILILSVANLLKIHLLNLKVSDLPNYVGMSVGVMGLVPSWWQARIAAKAAQSSNQEGWQERMEVIGNRFDARLDDITDRCNANDDRQNEQIAQMREELASIETQFKVKQVLYASLIEEIGKLRWELAQHQAQVNVASGVADLRLQIEDMRSQVRELKQV